MSNKRNLGERIKLTSYEEMFGPKDSNVANSTSSRNGEKLENSGVRNIDVTELHSFANHPFKVIDNEEMMELVGSIKENGILMPIIARKNNSGGYEIISGHRRTHAAQLAGLKTVPVIVKDYSDDESVVIMVDSNLQREHVLPSEKAKAYSMKYEAIRHQGKNTGITSSFEMLGESYGDGARTVQRYVKLAKLTDNMLELLDLGKLGIMQGEDIAFLSEEAQGWVYDIISNNNCTVSKVQSAIIKERFKAGELTPTLVMEILCYENPKKKRKVTFGAKKLSSYFAPNVSSEEIEKVIIGLLDEWKQKGGELSMSST